MSQNPLTCTKLIVVDMWVTSLDGFWNEVMRDQVPSRERSANTSHAFGRYDMLIDVH